MTRKIRDRYIPVKDKHTHHVFARPDRLADTQDMNNIAYYRKLRGLSQGELGQMVGIRQPHVSRIEGGDEGPPLRLFRDIANALNVSLADLFSDEMNQALVILSDAYRSAPESNRQMMLAMARAAAQPTKADLSKNEVDPVKGS